MSDPTGLPPRSTPHWNLYQREIFVGGTKSGGGTYPTFSTGILTNRVIILTQKTRTNWKSTRNTSFRSMAGTTQPPMQAPHSQTEPIAKRFTGIALFHACCATRTCETRRRNSLVTRSARPLCSRQLESIKSTIKMASLQSLKLQVFGPDQMKLNFKASLICHTA